MTLAALFAIGPRTAAAQESMLYSFGNTSTDAQSPESPLIFDSKGNLYGTSAGGGAHSYGTVFELSRGTGGVWTETVLYSFGVTTSDAEGPQNIVFDSNGNLFGTAGGGQYGYGAVFELSPQTGGTWTEQVIHSFNLGEADGYDPVGNPAVDSSGNVYVATSSGGAHNSGTVIEISPATGGTWTEKILVSFGPTFGVSGPAAGLVFDSKGNLYGTTYNGGANNGGTVFELSPGSGGVWTETVLHNFPVNLTTEGSLPNGELILDSAGNLYGITHSGGVDLYGTVFEVSPQTGGTWTEQVLYGFDPTNANADGENPVGGLAFDSKGNLYGATHSEGGGAITGDGGVFKLTPQSGGTWTEQLIHNFTGDYTPEDVAMDGIFPAAGVVVDASGNLYGTTTGGGINGEGAFYVIGPEPLVATPIFSPAAGNYGSTQTVTLTDATPGATIYYSNNGTPDTTSTMYSGPFTVSSTETLTAFATATGYVDSNYTVARFTITPTVATPSFSPSAGTYTSTQSVTISDSTSGATIYYTTNGTTPTTSSTKYTGAITVSATTTIEAIAAASGLTNSNVATAIYTIVLPTASAPAFSPAVGIYSTTQSVTLTDSTPGAVIYYTTNGTRPTASSTKYTGAITVSATTTIEAIATASGYQNSVVASGTYTIEPAAATPVISPAAGTYDSIESVTITDSTPGATIYYTTNGNVPTASSTKYTGAITVTQTETIQAIAIAGGYVNSAVASATYTITLAVGNAQVSILYSFNSEQLCPGFGLPSAPIFDNNGNLYGTCNGITGGGEVYEVSPLTGGGWNETTIYNDGLNLGNPNPGLIFDSAKVNLYGTENSGGAVGAGSVYELSPAAGGAWNLTTLYSFQNGSKDGQASAAGLVFDAAGNLYGTTDIGGANNQGTVFKLTPASGGGYTESILYSFGASASDGQNPKSSLIFDDNGNLYGSTYGGGGTGSDGTIFELSPGTGGTWTEQVVQSFSISGSPYGQHPVGDLVLDAAGNLYAVTSSGGKVLEFSPKTGGGWTTTVLHSFPAASGDGSTPTAGLSMDSKGNLYGTTSSGGANGFAGTIYEIVRNGQAWSEDLLYSFNQTDDIGYTPATTLTLDGSGNLYGITTQGGLGGGGTLFEFFSTPLAATPAFSPAAGTYSSAQSVTISDTTSGATIYYTTDGTTPTTASTKYTAPITVSASETLEAIAVATGYASSAAATATYTIETPAAAPVFSINAGTYTSVQTVTITDSTAGATIYYTTNGATPATSSTKYTDPITVSSTETLEAIAVASGYTDSAVASALYTINLPAAATPTFSPAAGTYTTMQSVTLSDTTTGAAIYYTTNGTTPTASSTPYTGSISVSSTETIEAIAVASGYTDSAVASGTYTITPPAATPTFSLAAGTYTSVQSVTLSDATAGATIYYTTNGVTPTTSSTKYTGAISVGATETIEAIAVATGYSASAVASALYTINLPTAAMPIFSPAAGAYTSAQTVTITDATAGSVIYYATNGATPTASSTKYTGAISVGATETLEAIAVVTGYTNSAVASATYTINIPVAATPVFSPAAGTYTAAQSVTIADSTAGAVIYYTTNGTTPTTSSIKYTGAISVGATETLEAIAVASGYTNSAVATALYTINIPVAATPVFSPAAGTYTAAQSVTITDATTGATIYYTTNGTTPTTASTQYTGAIAVSSTETLEAIAAFTGYTNSAVATATYTINVAPPSFTLSNSGTLTISQPGSTTGDTATITITSTGGYTGTVNLSCAVTAVPGAIAPTCILSSPSTTFSGSTTVQTTTLTVVTSATGATAANQSRPLFWPGAGGAAFALAFFFITKRKRNLLHMACLLMVIVSIAGLGCSGHSTTKSTGTTPGSYVVTVTGTAGTITQTTTINVTLN